MRVGKLAVEVPRLSRQLVLTFLMMTSVGLTAIAPGPSEQAVALESRTAAPCNTYKIPSDADQGSTYDQGVAGVIRTPVTLSSFGFGAPSMTTLWLISSNPAGADYVIFGWYVGSHNQLPYTDIPRIFYMERDISNPDGYRRRAGPNLGWNQYHTLSIWPHNPGSIYNDYYYYLDGNFRTSTVILHLRFNTAWFRGIVYQGGTDPTCTEMDARAQLSHDPWETLSACSGGNKPPPCDWHYFYDRFYSDPVYPISEIHGRATALAYGPLQ